MLGSPLSFQNPPLESLISTHRSPMNTDRGDRKENVMQIQNHISSLYEPDPFPGIEFHHDPINRWESIAKEILTPFAPKHPIYNYKKFLPARYQKILSPMMSPTSSLIENKNHHPNKPLFSRKVSFAENTIQMLFNNDKDPDDKELDQRLYKKFMSGSQTVRYENLRPNATEDTKKSSTLKRFLIIRESSQNILDMRQIQTRGKIRPQTAAESSGKDKARTLFIEANGNTVGNFSDEVSKNDKDTSDSTVEGESKKDNSSQGKLIPHPKVLAAMKAAKEAGKLTTQGSRRSFLVTDKPFITRSSFQKEDRSREGSIRNDSKFSVMFKKMADEEANKANRITKMQSNIRRKSDTSRYSGGECLKLTKNMDIILPSDNIRRFKHNTPSPLNELKKEGAIINLLKTKKKSEYDKKKDIRNSQGSPRNTPNIPFLETINSTQVVKSNDFEVKSPGMDHSTSRKSLELNQRTKSMSQARVSHLRAITPLAANSKMIFGLDEFSNIKSKTPGASRESPRSRIDIMNEKTSQIQTSRSARHGKAIFEKRLKHGDLSGALQVVLDLNKKAQITVFRNDQIRTSRPGSTRRGKDETKYGSKGDLDKERDSSPYVKPMSVKKGDTKGGLLACESIKEETPRQMKKPRKKIAFLTSRSKSVPKINELPTLEKIYL